MKPAKIVVTKFEKTYYQSYWMKCIEHVLDYSSPLDVEGIGYYSLFYMPEEKVWYQNSYKLGGDYSKYERDKDFKLREAYFNQMKILSKRIEYDLDNDDEKLKLHSNIYIPKNPNNDEEQEYSDYDFF